MRDVVLTDIESERQELDFARADSINEQEMENGKSSCQLSSNDNSMNMFQLNPDKTTSDHTCIKDLSMHCVSMNSVSQINNNAHFTKSDNMNSNQVDLNNTKQTSSLNSNDESMNLFQANAVKSEKLNNYASVDDISLNPFGPCIHTLDNQNMDAMEQADDDMESVDFDYMNIQNSLQTDDPNWLSFLENLSEQNFNDSPVLTEPVPSKNGGEGWKSSSCDQNIYKSSVFSFLKNSNNVDIFRSNNEAQNKTNNTLCSVNPKDANLNQVNSNDTKQTNYLKHKDKFIDLFQINSMENEEVNTYVGINDVALRSLGQNMDVMEQVEDSMESMELDYMNIQNSLQTEDPKWLSFLENLSEQNSNDSPASIEPTPSTSGESWKNSSCDSNIYESSVCSVSKNSTNLNKKHFLSSNIAQNKKHQINSNIRFVNSEETKTSRKKTSQKEDSKWLSFLENLKEPNFNDTRDSTELTQSTSDKVLKSSACDYNIHTSPVISISKSSNDVNNFLSSDEIQIQIQNFVSRFLSCKGIHNVDLNKSDAILKAIKSLTDSIMQYCRQSTPEHCSTDV